MNRQETQDPTPTRRSIRSSVIAAGSGAALPLLIACSVLLVLFRFVLERRATTQHFDVLPLWLPTHCFLGSALRSGHIPAWNPFAMAGAPFAADPQSGWLYLPAMALYAALPCGTALGWFVVLQPAIGGLGTYAFLRSEGTGRSAAGVGGVTLALSMAASYTAISLPFAGAVAWSMVTLAAVSRLWHAPSWSRRCLWLLAAALAWGQLASAHMSHGLLIGSAAVVAYLIARLVVVANRDRARLPRAAILVVLVALVFPAVNLAILLPRLEYVRASSLANGYQGVEESASSLTRGPPPKPPTGSTGAVKQRWPLGMTMTPGAYLGASAIALLAAGLWSRRHRAIAIAFLVFASASYLLSLRSVAETVAPIVRGFAVGDLYLHAPARLRFGVVIAAPLLAGLGVEAWRERRTPRQRLGMVAPALLVFAILPTALGYRWAGQWIPLAGAIAGGAVLVAAVIRPRALVLLPVILAGELATNGLAGQAGLIQPKRPAGGFVLQALGPLRRPDVNVGMYLRPPGFVGIIRSGPPARYLPLLKRSPGRLGLGGFTTAHGYLTLTAPKDRPLLANQQSMLFRIEDVGGSDNPVQVRRYWSYVRAVNDRQMMYNAAFLTPPEGSTLDLLQVRWVIVPSHAEPPLPDVVRVAREGRWALYRLRHPAPRASVVTRWRAVRDADAALHAVVAPTFDPERTAVVEGAPPFPTAARSIPGGATFRWEGTQAAVITATSPGPAVILIRNTYAPGWHATVDGREATVRPVDYVDQGVAVSAGRHIIRLTYDDPTLGYGLAGSGVAVALLLVAAALARRRRGRPPGQAVSRRNHGGEAPIEATEAGILGPTRR